MNELTGHQKIRAISNGVNEHLGEYDSTYILNAISDGVDNHLDGAIWTSTILDSISNGVCIWLEDHKEEIIEAIASNINNEK